MILRQFPDIDLVRSLRNEPVKPANKWMNVALNIRCSQVSRTGVESPYSLFLNNKGFSYCRANKQRYRIETDKYLLTQPGEMYDLIIDNSEQTEICNIHINRDFFAGWSYALTTGAERLLAEPEPDGYTVPTLFTQLYSKDNIITQFAERLTLAETADNMAFELLMGDIIQHLLATNEQVRKSIGQLPFIRRAVREDIYRRLALAKDYIYCNYQSAVDLDGICRETGMSKFHLLRMFKQCFGITPYQYLLGVRMNKAKELLTGTAEPISEIAYTLGFEHPNSFIKAFQKAYGIAPGQYRSRRLVA